MVTPVRAAPPRPPLQRRHWSLGFLVLAFALTFVAYRGLPVGLPAGVRPFLPFAIANLLLLATAWLLRREGSSLHALGLAPGDGAGWKLLLGLVTGAALFSVAAGGYRLTLPLRWEVGAPTARAIAELALGHLLTNACEELAFRGYAFRGLRAWLGLRVALALIAALYAAFHVLCGWTWQVALLNTVPGALLFGLIVVRWQSLPAALGVHAAWNISRDLVLAVPAGPAALLVPVLQPLSPGQQLTAQLITAVVLLGPALLIAFRLRSTAR